MSGFEGSYLGDASRLPPGAKLECGICWWVYDPELGDEVAQIPPGTPFSALPAHWRCPACDAESRKFMVVGAADLVPAAARDRVAALVAAAHAADAKMRGLPVHNPALEVEAVGFAPEAAAPLGVLVTPWSMNLVRLPAEDEAPLAEGSSRELPFASGSYPFIAGRLDGVGPVEQCSLFSPMDAFADQATAVLVAREVLRQLHELPAPAAVSRRSLLRTGSDRS